MELVKQTWQEEGKKVFRGRCVKPQRGATTAESQLSGVLQKRKELLVWPWRLHRTWASRRWRRTKETRKLSRDIVDIFRRGFRVRLPTSRSLHYLSVTCGSINARDPTSHPLAQRASSNRGRNTDLSRLERQRSTCSTPPPGSGRRAGAAPERGGETMMLYFRQLCTKK